MTKTEAKKQGLAWWEKDTIVEIGLMFQRQGKRGKMYHDPNNYRARCLTEGTWPKVEVLTAEDEPHPDFPDALLPKEYYIWRALRPRAYTLKNGEVFVVVDNPGTSTYRIVRGKKREVVKDGFASIEDAVCWISEYEAGDTWIEGEVKFNL